MTTHSVYIPMYVIASTYIYNYGILNSLIQRPISNVSIIIFLNVVSDHVSTINTLKKYGENKRSD